MGGFGKPHTGVKYLDVQKNKDIFSLPIEKSWNSFIYIYEGAIKSGLFMEKGSLGILDTDEVFECEVLKENTKLLLILENPSKSLLRGEVHLS